MTYQQISEQIRTLVGNGIVSDDFNFSLRYIAELVAQEVAVQARKNAFEIATWVKRLMQMIRLPLRLQACLLFTIVY